MSVRAVVGVLALAVVAALAFAVLGGGEDPYRARLQLANADGLIKGSPVTIGSVEVGSVADLGVDRQGRVVADLDIDADRGPLGAGAAAEIRASNLLGSKLVRLEPGDRGRPLPDGAVIPPSRTQTPVDLQDVVDVLDADTRTRLAVLVNEAGTALTGREADFNTLLARMPSSLGAARRLVEAVDGDNRALADVVRSTDSYLAAITPERRDVARIVSSFAGTFETIAGRRAELRETLRRAPGTLRTLQGFLGDLERTTVPLGPAARTLQATARPLVDTLSAVPGFTDSAEPTLAKATDVAPTLTRLARRATPVLRRAVPTASTLAAFARDLGPASSALGLSIDDLLATIQGWARAIQQRDGISHFFRADISISPDLLQSAVDKGTMRRLRRAARQQGRDGGPRPAAAPQTGGGQLPAAERLPLLGGLDLPRLPKAGVPAVDQALEQTSTQAQDLLDYLLKP